MSEEKKLAVLIDSDNVSAKYAQFIMQEAVKYGTPTYKRVYGDWEKGGNGWHTPAINYSIMPVQQTSYIAGKNATDFSMIIDAMDILYTGKVDGFVLVTSDSDFTRLAIRLREAGMLVVGIGELKTPRAFTASCSHFCYLNQVCLPDDGEADEKTIRKSVLDFVTDNKDQRIDLAKISAVLTSKFGNINFDELGYKRFSSFIDSFPELRRSNTFVTLRKKREDNPPPAPLPAGAPTEQDIKAAIDEYFSKNAPSRDNMMKIESYLTNIFGMIDFSRFGSKRFAKFIDKLDGYTRNGTDVAPVGAEKPAAVTEEATSPEIAESIPDAAKVEALVLNYAGTNMPDGGNLGQLNNLLMADFGKGYLAAMGYADLKSLLAMIKDVRVRKNHVFLTDTKYAEFVENALKSAAAKKQQITPAADISPEKTEETPAAEEVQEQGVPDLPAQTSEKPEKKSRRRRRGTKSADSETASAENIEETPAQETQVTPADEAPEEVTEKAAPDAQATPEINAVKRDVLLFASSDEDGNLSRLGNIMTQKYGKGWLKALGYSTIKKLLASMRAVTVKGNKVNINEEFAAQTEEIEQFVADYAKNSSTKSVRALSTQLKKRFEQFDISDYGFAKFTDFINAIDGVKADRYHVRVSKQGE